MRSDARALRLPIKEVGVAFFLNGLMFGAWFPYVNTIAARLGLDDEELGTALIGLPGGLIVGAFVYARLWARLGNRPLLVVGMLTYCGGMALPGLASNQYWLALALFVPGLGNGILDPASHLEVNTFERSKGRSLQGYFMGIFSGAQLVQAVGAPFAIGFGVPPLAYLGAAATIGVLATVWVSPRIFRADRLPLETHESGIRRQRRFRWWAWALALAVLFLAAAATEGIWADWHGVYLSGRGIGASFAVAALGYTFFQVAAVVTRFSLPSLVNSLATRLDDDHDRGTAMARSWIAWGAILIALAGALLIVTATSPAMGLAGAATLGLGAGPIGPIAVSTAGDDPWAVTLANGIGYTGLVAAPAAMGFLAAQVTLRTALWTLVVATLLMALTAVAIRSRPVAGGHRWRGLHRWHAGYGMQVRPGWSIAAMGRPPTGPQISQVRSHS